MKPTTIFASLLVSFNLFSQTPTLDWAKQTGGSGNAFGVSISVDNSENSYTSGIFTATIDCDPGPGTFSLTSGSPVYNAFISKLDPSGNFVWAKAFTSTVASIIHSTEIDDQGNIYLAGYFDGTCDFDPNPSTTFNLTSSGIHQDAFVCKLDATGDFVWAKNTGNGGSFTTPNDIHIDMQGNIITVGEFNGLVDFDPGPGIFNLNANNVASFDSDVFVSKLDSNGNFIWAKRIGAAGGNDKGTSFSIDSLGSIYLTGHFSDTVDFDPNSGLFSLIATGSSNAFVCKLDASGNLTWAGRFGGTGSNSCYAHSLITSSLGKIYVSGRYTDTVDFDPGIGVANKTSNGGTDLYVVELDTSGNFDWVQSMGGPYTDACSAVRLDNNGNIYLYGNFQDTVDFDPGSGTYNLTAAALFNSFICKLTNTGTFVWAIGLGDFPISIESARMTLDDSNNIYSTGRFLGTTDFDPDTTVFNLTATSGFDCYTLKLNPCASSTPSISITSSEGDTICDSANVVFTASVINGGTSPGYQWKKNGINVGTNSTSYSSSALISGDIITCELTSNDPCAVSNVVSSNAISMTVNQSTTGTDTQIACEAFTWIDGNTYTSPNNTATYTLTSAQGCDSIVTLDLSFLVLDVSVTNSDPTLTSNATGVTYQWIDCENSFVTIPGETNSSFTPTSNGVYAVIVSSNGCSDTSSCEAISTVGIDAIDIEVFTVYPNPTSGKLSIDLPVRNGDLKLRIINSIGQIIVSRTFHPEEELTLSFDSESGFYIVEIETEERNILKSTFIKSQ